MKNKVTQFLLFFITLSFSLLANAAGPEGAIATGTAAINLASAGQASISITPVQNLTAGTYDIGTILAQFTVKASSGTIIWRYTPGTGTIMNTVGYNPVPSMITVTGHNNSKNTLTLYLYIPDLSAIAVPGEGNWMIMPRPGGYSSSATGSIQVMSPDQSRNPATINPDIYTVSFDAAIWQS